jgi:two-component system, LuxR family, response regulator FixJ
MTCDPTIHVVDDDQAMRDSLNSLLMVEGYAVCTHASARTILETIQDTDRGCIVTDIHMPEISGLDLLAALNERRVSLPVIVITGRSDRWLAAEAMREGAFDFFEKPLNIDALLVSIRGALSRRGRELFVSTAPDTGTPTYVGHELERKRSKNAR